MDTYDPRQSPRERLEQARGWAAAEPPHPQSRAAALEGVSERLQTVIAAAERAAEAIRYDAGDQARRHLAEAQQKADRLTAERIRLVAELTDDLIEHAAVVKSRSEEMLSALEEAIETVQTRLGEADASDRLGAGHADIPAAAPPSRPDTTRRRTETTVEEPPERFIQAFPGSGAPPVEAEIRRKTEVTTEGTGDESAAGPPLRAPLPSGETAEKMLLRAAQLAVTGGKRESIAEALLEEFGSDPSEVLDQVLPRPRPDADAPGAPGPDPDPDDRGREAGS